MTVETINYIVMYNCLGWMKNNVFYRCFTPEQAVVKDGKCKEDGRMVKEIESPVVLLLQKENAFVDEDE